MRRLMGLAACLVLLAAIGCDAVGRAPTLDCTSEEAYEASLKRMAAGMTAEEMDEWHKAMAFALLEGSMRRWADAPEKKQEPKGSEVLQEYHGLTAQQLIAAVNKKRAAMDGK